MPEANKVLSHIILTKKRYADELARMGSTGELPGQVCALLGKLVIAQIHSTIPPQANPALIDLVREHLLGGVVLLSDSGSEEHYEVMVYIPGPGQEERRVSRFRLIPKYVGCRLKYLTDL